MLQNMYQHFKTEEYVHPEETPSQSGTGVLGVGPEVQTPNTMSVVKGLKWSFPGSLADCKTILSLG